MNSLMRRAFDAEVVSPVMSEGFVPRRSAGKNVWILREPGGWFRDDVRPIISLSSSRLRTRNLVTAGSRFRTSRPKVVRYLRF